MNILPQQLIGKIVYDCYLDASGQVIIEFTDGSKIAVKRHKFENKRTVGGKEIFISLEL